MSEAQTQALEPPDLDRCQAMRPNKTWSPFAFGPADTLASGEKVGGSRQNDKLWRCNEKPALVVTETESDDEQLGSMSVCSDCFVQLCLQRGGTFKVTQDLTGESREANSGSTRFRSR